MMKQWMAAALLVMTPLAAGAAPAAADELGARLAQGYIGPAMQQYHDSAARMRVALGNACADADADAEGGDDVAAAFEGLVASWAGIEFLRFGPLVDSNRFERIYFWPDPRGITTRQVQGLLAKPPSEIPDADVLSTHSVALQGLPALEYVLYRDGGLLSGGQVADRPSACAYAMAVAENLKRIGSELAAQWGQDGEQARLFAHPDADNPLYRTPQEVAAEVVKALSTGLQFQTDVKLAPALGQEAKSANVRKAPFWRSELTTTSVKAAVQGMLAFYRSGGYQYEGADWIDQNIQGELQRAVDHLAQMKAGPEQLFGTEDGHQELVLVKLLLKNAKDLVDQDMAPALGVRIGFNALDGD